jgi:2'-5' RNA ligase
MVVKLDTSRRAKVIHVASIIEAERAKIVADHNDGSSVGVFIPVSDTLASQFPDLGDADTSKPHLTVLYIGDVPESRRDKLVAAVREVTAKYPQMDLHLDGEVSYFDPTEFSDGKRVAKLAVSADGLQELHADLREAVTAAGFEIDHAFPKYEPHVTLGYIDPNTSYTSTVPSGSWAAKAVEVWGWEEHVQVPFGGNVETLAANKRIKKKWAKKANDAKKAKDAGKGDELQPDAYREEHGKCPEGYHFKDGSCQKVAPSKDSDTDPGVRESKPETPADDTLHDDQDIDDQDIDGYDEYDDQTTPTEDTDKHGEEAEDADVVKRLEKLRGSDLGFITETDPKTGDQVRVKTKRQKLLDDVAKTDWKTYEAEVKRMRESGELPDLETGLLLSKIKDWRDLPDDVKRDKEKLTKLVEQQNKAALHEERVLNEQIKYLEEFEYQCSLAEDRGEKPPVLEPLKMMAEIERQIGRTIPDAKKEKCSKWLDENVVRNAVRRSGVKPASKRYSFLKFFEVMFGPQKPLRMPKFKTASSSLEVVSMLDNLADELERRGDRKLALLVDLRASNLSKKQAR